VLDTGSRSRFEDARYDKSLSPTAAIASLNSLPAIFLGTAGRGRRCQMRLTEGGVVTAQFRKRPLVPESGHPCRLARWLLDGWEGHPDAQRRQLTRLAHAPPPPPPLPAIARPGTWTEAHSQGATEKNRAGGARQPTTAGFEERPSGPTGPQEPCVTAGLAEGPARRCKK